MYKNLKAEMTRNEIQRKDIADFLGLRYATVVDKINGKYQFKLEEAFSIKKDFSQTSALSIFLRLIKVQEGKRVKWQRKKQITLLY